MLSPLPSFAVKKKVMDIILPIDPLSGVVEEFTSDEEEKKDKKKKKKKGNPGTKKNKANFSSFRNKDY